MYRKPLWRVLAWALPLLLVSAPFWGRRMARAQHPGSDLRLGRQEVSVEVDDPHSLAVTTIRQEFRNGSWSDQEGVLDLPLSDEAALLRCRVLSPPPRKGEKEEERARLEATGRNQYRAVVSRVPGRGAAVLEVAYAEVLTRRGRRRKYVYPVSTGEGAAPAGIRFQARVAARSAPQRAGSATHPMTLRRPSPQVTLLSYEQAEPLDGRDLVIDYEVPPQPEDTRARLSVLVPAAGEDPYFLLALPPPAALLRRAAARDRPVDVVFCMDVSGSTRGRKLNAIREAVHDGLADLLPGDRFAVVAFDDDTRAFRRDLASADAGSVAKALRFVNRLRPGAGSDPARALQAAVEILEARPAASGRQAILAVVVDHEDPADLGEAAHALRLAQKGVRFVPLGALEDSRVVSYRTSGRKLHAGPAVALSRPALAYGSALSAAALLPGPLNVSYLYPAPERLPNLALSTPVILTGRLNQAPPARGKVTLAGKLEGRMESFDVEYVWEPLKPEAPVRALWANRRVRRLKQLAGRERGDREELLEAVDRVRAEGGLAAAPGG